jgi:hypothetical protein
MTRFGRIHADRSPPPPTHVWPGAGSIRPGAVVRSTASSRKHIGSFLTFRGCRLCSRSRASTAMPLSRFRRRRFRNICSGSTIVKQPGAENVSAVLFSNAGTDPKFNRIGQERHHRFEQVRMIRYGACYDHDPNASAPNTFAYEVGNSNFPAEPWRQGSGLTHNPQALHPIPMEWIGAEESLGERGNVIPVWRDPFMPIHVDNKTIPQEHADPTDVGRRNTKSDF